MSESLTTVAPPSFGGTQITQVRRLALRPRFEIERPRLAVPQGFGAGGVRVVALAAPAGYGKSTIAARWREQLLEAGVTCCWVGLQPKHRDAKSLLVDLIGQIQRQLDGIELPTAQRMLKAATSTTVEPVLAGVIGDLEQNTQRFVLVLDDLEQLQDSAGEVLVQSLVTYRPDCMDLLLCSRLTSQFSLNRERVAGRLADLRAADLAFSPTEIRHFLEAYLGTPPSDDVVDALASKSEGWPAAVGLFAQVAERHGATQAMAGFDGQSLELAEYLNDVILSSLPNELQGLMMRASVPDRFNLELLGLLVPGHDPIDTLTRLQEATPFLHVVQTDQLECRFHSLCADYLRRRLRRSQPALYENLLAEVGAWCWKTGNLHEAVNCARAAGQWDLMAQRLEVIADHMVRAAGELDAYLSWMRDIPSEVLARHPQLFIHQSWALCFKREMAQAEIALSRLESLLPGLPDEAAGGLWRQLTLHRSMIHSIRDRSHRELDRIREWLARYPNAPPEELGQAYCVLASAARNTNQHELALQAIQRADEIFRPVGGDYSLSWVHNIRLATLIKSGRFTEAVAVGTKSLEAIKDALGDCSTAAGMSHAMLGYLAYERGDADEASRHLDLGLRFIANQGVVDPLYYAYLTHSWLAADEGNEALAADLLLEGEQLGMQMDLPRLTRQLATRRVIRLLQAGDQLAADSVIRERALLDVSADVLDDSAARCAELIRLNRELLQGKFGEAAARARCLSRTVGTHGGLRMKAEYDFLWAIALHGGGEEKEAARRLRILLAESAEQRRYGFMLHYQRLAAGAITSLYTHRQAAWAAGARQDAADSMLRIIAGRLGLGERPDVTPPSADMVDGLTQREIEILSRAARTGLNNRKLAEALFVSEGTLKWHLHNIYVKLGVRNRTGAIAQAQRLGLLHL